MNTAEVVTWIKVEKPVFDLVGVVLGSFTAAGLLVAAALVLGTAAGVLLIRRRRHQTQSAATRLEL